MEKSKFYRKNTSSNNRKAVETTKPSYAQILSKNINNILKIKKNFLKLLNKKIKELSKLIYNKSDKPKPKINMTTKGPSRKQIIVPMSNNNTNKFMTTLSKYVTNLNWTLISGVVHIRSESPWEELRDVQTCRTTLASAYMLCHLSTIWSQLQKIRRSLNREWVLIWYVIVEHQKSSSIRSYLCQLSD